MFTIPDSTKANFEVNKAAQCLSGNEFIFTNKSSGSAPLSFAWNFGDGSTSTSPDSIVKKTYAAPGSYIVTLSVSGQAGVANYTSTVVVNATPSKGFTVNNASQVQAGNNFLFTTTNPQAGGTYLWNFGDGSTSQTTSPNKVYQSAGNYSVKQVVTSLAGCKDSASSSVVVTPNQPTVASYTVVNPEQCFKGHSFSFINTSSGEGTLSFQWSFGDGTISDVTNPVKSYTTPGTYIVTLTVNGGGGYNSVSKTVIVNGEGQSGFSVNQQTQYLSQNSFEFQSSMISASQQYLWDFGNGTTSAEVNPSKSYASAGTYLVKQTVSLNGKCPTSAEKSVVVQPNAPTISSFTVNNKEQCSGSNSFVFTNNSTGTAPISYLWNFGDGTTTTEKNPVKTYASVGNYTVSLTTTGAGGVNTASTTVTVYTTAHGGFTVDLETQPLTGNSFVFKSTGDPAFQTYQWTFGDGTSSSSVNPNKHYNNVGTYTVTQTVLYNGKCPVIATKSVTVEPNITTVAAFNVNNVKQCQFENSFVFTNTSAGSTPITYSWNFGDGSSSTLKNPAHTYSETGVYTVTLQVNAAAGNDTKSMDVEVVKTPSSVYGVDKQNSPLKDNSFTFTSQPGADSYAWDFGDGTTSVEPNPVKSFAETGYFEVFLHASIAGCTSEFSRVIVIESDEIGSGSEGGLESESLGDLISRRDFNRIKNSVNKKIDYSKLPVFKQHTLNTKSTNQTLDELIPAELVPGDELRITSPTDLVEYTNAVEVISVDYLVEKRAKAVVLGLKTVDLAYGHTKSVCDRFRGGEMTAVEDVEIQGYHFPMFVIKQENDAVEYAISFAVGKSADSSTYALQTNWIIRSIQAADTLYNMQVWASKPEYTKKLVSDILDNLKKSQPVVQTNLPGTPELYITKGERKGGKLDVEVFNTTSSTSARLHFEQKQNENSAYVEVDYPLTVQNGLNKFTIDVQDGYEYNGSLYLNEVQTDQVYMADGGWLLDYDKQFTTVNQFTTGNDGAREYPANEFALYRGADVNASSNDYLILFRSIRSSMTQQTDLRDYNAVKFFAKGTGKLTVKLIRDSIVDWKAQYKSDFELDPKGKEVLIRFSDFHSDQLGRGLYAKDLTSIQFSHGTTAGSSAKETIAFAISDVSFAKVPELPVIPTPIVNLMVGPNPFTTYVNCRFESPKAEEVTVTLTDALGRIVANQVVNAVQGANSIRVDLSNADVSKGLVVVTVKGNTINFASAKVLKQ